MAVRTDSRMSPVTLKVLSLLEDGEWHDQEEVIAEAMYIIPPGEAFRIGQKRSSATVDRRSQDEIIASGQRSKTVDTLNSLISNNRVEREGADPTHTAAKGKRVRLVEDIPVVYVTRAKDGTLSVHNTNRQRIAVHVIDAQTKTEPDRVGEELRDLRAVFEAIPNRVEGKDRLQAVCRSVLNDLSVRNALVEASREFGDYNHANENDRSDTP